MGKTRLTKEEINRIINSDEFKITLKNIGEMLAHTYNIGQKYYGVNVENVFEKVKVVDKNVNKNIIVNNWHISKRVIKQIIDMMNEIADKTQNGKLYTFDDLTHYPSGTIIHRAFIKAKLVKVVAKIENRTQLSCHFDTYNHANENNVIKRCATKYAIRKGLEAYADLNRKYQDVKDAKANKKKPEQVQLPLENEHVNDYTVIPDELPKEVVQQTVSKPRKVKKHTDRFVVDSEVRIFGIPVFTRKVRK